MSKTHTFEIHGLDDGHVWVRPYVGNEEFNGETFAALVEALAALPTMASDLGWTEYAVTVGQLKEAI
jgi:hypothetical protein